MTAAAGLGCPPRNWPGRSLAIFVTKMIIVFMTLASARIRKQIDKVAVAGCLNSNQTKIYAKFENIAVTESSFKVA
jgi:hypothetical protein